MTGINAAIQEIDEKIHQLEEARATLLSLGGTVGYSTPRPAKSVTGVVTRRPMSEESKQRVREAQARRWAKVNADKAAAAQGAQPQLLGTESAQAAVAGGEAPDSMEPPTDQKEVVVPPAKKKASGKKK